MRTDKDISRLIEKMSDFELARWYALLDAVDLIAEKAADRKLRFENVDIKPSAIEHYIEATCDVYCKKIIENKIAEKRKVIKRAKKLLPDLTKIFEIKKPEPFIVRKPHEIHSRI